MNASTKLLGFAVISALFATPSAYADNCSGFYGSEGGFGETIEMANGAKITYFTNHGTVSSADSGHSGVGGCAGYVYAMSDGKGWVAGSCTMVSTKGDNWSYNFFEDLGANGKGNWKGVAGTGQFASNEKTSGWYQGTAMAGKTSTGKWGGTCVK